MPGLARSLVSQRDSKSPIVEAYRTLRTNLKYANAGEPLKKILITSPGPGEGKSTISANLGYLLAQAGLKTVVVGVDLRKPSLHHYFHVPNSRGITNVLVGQAAWEECLVKIQEAENLYFLPSGPTPPNPAELLGSAKMSELIDKLTDYADIVLFDAPPVIAVIDAAVIAPKVDGALLVVNSGTTPRELAIRSKEQLEQVGAHILGVVLNRVEVKAGYGYYYYYYSNAVEHSGERHIKKR